MNGPIPWIRYDPKAKITSDTTSSADSSDTEEADITDAHDLKASDSKKVVALVTSVTPATPSIRITLCVNKRSVTDVNFEMRPTSPVVIQHNPAVDYLQIPIPGPTQSSTTKTSQSVRSNVTGKQFVLATPIGKKKRSAPASNRAL